MNSRIVEARNTCNGIGRLVSRLNNAAVDIDKGGESTYELLSLLATTQDCISNLSTQLEHLNNLDRESEPETSNVSVLRAGKINNTVAEQAPEERQAIGSS